MTLTKDQITAALVLKTEDSKRAKATAYLAIQRANEIHARYTFTKRHSGFEGVNKNGVFHSCESNWLLLESFIKDEPVGDGHINLVNLEAAREMLGDRLGQPKAVPYERQTDARLGTLVIPRKGLVEEISLPYSAAEIRAMKPNFLRKIMSKPGYTEALNKVLREEAL